MPKATESPDLAAEVQHLRAEQSALRDLVLQVAERSQALADAAGLMYEAGYGDAMADRAPVVPGRRGRHLRLVAGPG